jgi:protein-histidine N-methyltransferase
MPRTPDRTLERLIRWLTTGEARFPKLCIERHDGGERGARAAAGVEAGEEVVYIPRRFLLTQAIARASAIGRAIAAAGVLLESEDSILAAFLLQEKKRPRSFWKPYLDALPASFPGNPLFFDARELALLEGSPLLERLSLRRASLAAEHARLSKHVPAFAPFGVEELVWARLVVISRNFGLTIDGAQTRALVPLADLLDHRMPRETEWAYAEDAGGFSMTARGPFARGAPVHACYGAKSNGRFLLNYGFALPDNEDDETTLDLAVPADVPFAALKRRLLGLDLPGSRRLFRIASRRADPEAREPLSFLRVACADESELAALEAAPVFDSRDVEPVSVANEARAIELLGAACARDLARYPTSIEEDDALLATPGLPRNARHAVLVRRGEKRLLRDYLAMTRSILDLLRLPAAELEGLASPGAESALGGDARDSVVLAVRNDPWMALGRAARLGHRLDRAPVRRPRAAPRGREAAPER